MKKKSSTEEKRGWNDRATGLSFEAGSRSGMARGSTFEQITEVKGSHPVLSLLLKPALLPFFIVCSRKGTHNGPGMWFGTAGRMSRRCAASRHGKKFNGKRLAKAKPTRTPQTSSPRQAGHIFSFFLSFSILLPFLLLSYFACGLSTAQPRNDPHLKSRTQRPTGD